MGKSAQIELNGKTFLFYPADLDHIKSAVILLRKRHEYTASERLAYIGGLIGTHFMD